MNHKDLLQGYRKSMNPGTGYNWLDSLKKRPREAAAWSWKDETQVTAEDQDIGESKTAYPLRKAARTQWTKPKTKVTCAVGGRTGVLALPKFRAQMIPS